MSAPTKATASVQTLDGTGGVIFDSSSSVGPCNAFAVFNDDTTNNILVNVLGLHAAGDFHTIKPGESFVFGEGVSTMPGITSVFAKSSSTSSVCRWTVAGKR